MSWQNTTLSHLSAMFLTLGAFAGTAAAQQALGDFTDQGDVGTRLASGLGELRQGDRHVHDRRLGRERLGGSRRVPLRVAEDEGRLHPHRARRARRARASRRTASSGG